MNLTLIIIATSLSIGYIFPSDVQCQQRQKGVEIPADYATLVLVNSPSCPIQLNGPTSIILFDDKSVVRGYGIHFDTQKKVAKFVIEQFSWFGNTSLRKTFTAGDIETRRSQQDFSTRPPKSKIELRQFEDEKASSMGLSKRPRDIWLIMVKTVTFVDGTIYDASSQHKRLEAFIDSLELYRGMDQTETATKETRLQNFISNLFRDS